MDNFSSPSGPNILVTSLRVAAVAMNLKAASRAIFADYPPSASTALQALARIVRIGAVEEAIVEILLQRYSIDQILAAAMENKYIPIIAGQAGLNPSEQEVEDYMEERGVPQESFVDRFDLYKKRWIDKEARAIFKKLFGTC